MSSNAPDFKTALGLGRAARQAMVIDGDQLVRTRPLATAGRIPLLVEPAMAGVDLVQWAKAHAAEVDELLLAHRALLFRGFRIASIERFQAFVAATSEGEPLEYRDRSTPRTTVGEGVYVSTIYPRDQAIHLHNEGTYWTRFAVKIYFCCLRAAATGGQTPIADVRKVLARLDPEVRDRFRDQQVMYVRNYNSGIGLPWQEVFQSDAREEVEAYCRANAIQCEWKPDGTLRSRQIRPAIRHHPRTGEEVWFNHAAFFHVTSLEPAMRTALLRQFGEEGLPYNTYYGDGTAIDPLTIAHIRQAYEEEKVTFLWQDGDVLLLDNLSVAHAREPYTGERQVIVAMTEATTGDVG
jgi:alpha-ketoglutarate-dependent taurine dioxygenase